MPLQNLKVGYQVSFLDVAQCEHFVFTIHSNRDHFASDGFDNTLPSATVLYRHAQDQADFFTEVTRIVFCGELRELDLNQRPSGYEPDELPDCSIPRGSHISAFTLLQHNQSNQPD